MTAFRTIIIPAALVMQARELGASLAPAGINMFETALSATGMPPASHYISSGMIDDPFAPILNDGTALYAAAQQGATVQGLTLTITQTDCNNLVSQAIISDGTYTDAQRNVSQESAYQMLARLGLAIINQ